MKRRWIIRSFFIGVMVLCIGGWAVSLVSESEISWMGDSLWTADAAGGRIGLEYWPDYGLKYGWRTGDPTWTCFVLTHNYNRTPYVLDGNTADYAVNWNLLYFRALWNDPNQPGRWALGIPFWFPTLLSTACVWLVWRKSRQKAEGFPVEVANGKEEP